MQKWISKIILVAITVILFVTSSGIVMGIHYCKSMKKSEFFFFERDYKCENELKSGDSCAHETSCCSHHSTNEVQKHKNCCSNNVITVKIQDDYLPVNYKFVCNSIEINSMVSEIEYSISLPTETRGFYILKRPPPKPNEQNLNIWFGNLKIPASFYV